MPKTKAEILEEAKVHMAALDDIQFLLLNLADDTDEKTDRNLGDQLARASELTLHARDTLKKAIG